MKFQNFVFGTHSKSQLATCDERIVRVATRALSMGVIDFKVLQGARTDDEQDRLFDEGKTKVRAGQFSTEEVDVLPADYGPAKFQYVSGAFVERTDIEAPWDGLARPETISRITFEIRQEARRRILVDHPEWKQRNYALDWLELSEKRAGGGTLTQGERDKLQSLRQAQAQIAAIQGASNLIQAQIPSDEASAGAFDVSNNPRWPA